MACRFCAIFYWRQLREGGFLENLNVASKEFLHPFHDTHAATPIPCDSSRAARAGPAASRLSRDWAVVELVQFRCPRCVLWQLMRRPAIFETASIRSASTGRVLFAALPASHEAATAAAPGAPSVAVDECNAGGDTTGDHRERMLRIVADLAAAPMPMTTPNASSAVERVAALAAVHADVLASSADVTRRLAAKQASWRLAGAAAGGGGPGSKGADGARAAAGAASTLLTFRAPSFQARGGRAMQARRPLPPPPSPPPPPPPPSRQGF